MMSFVIRLDPILTQKAPASNQDLRFSSVGETPPEGISCDQGHGALTAFMKDGPPICDAG